MNPEFFDHISERLFNSGVSDVFLTNIIMKKGRPGIILNVIAEKELADTVKEILFNESTTLGIRTFPFAKDTLVRKFEQINTEWGKVSIKRSFYKGKEVSCKPEYEECKKIAAKLKIPVKEVYNSIVSEIIRTMKK